MTSHLENALQLSSRATGPYTTDVRVAALSESWHHYLQALLEQVRPIVDEDSADPTAGLYTAGEIAQIERAAYDRGWKGGAGETLADVAEQRDRLQVTLQNITNDRDRLKIERDEATSELRSETDRLQADWERVNNREVEIHTRYGHAKTLITAIRQQVKAESRLVGSTAYEVERLIRVAEQEGRI